MLSSFIYAPAPVQIRISAIVRHGKEAGGYGLSMWGPASHLGDQE